MECSRPRVASGAVSAYSLDPNTVHEHGCSSLKNAQISSPKTVPNLLTDEIWPGLRRRRGRAWIRDEAVSDHGRCGIYVDEAHMIHVRPVSVAMVRDVAARYDVIQYDKPPEEVCVVARVMHCYHEALGEGPHGMFAMPSRA